jgi:hypothetical protein
VSQTSSLYAACSEIFASYPLAIDACDDDVSSVVLLVRQGDDARFFLLSRDSGESTPFFLLRPWRAHPVVHIGVGSGQRFPEAVVKAITCGVPIPRHGSLFGWKAAESVTAMIAVYADYDPAFPQPSWAVMPLVGIPEAQWPPFTGERFFGQWFWEHQRGGSIVSLDDLIAGTPGTVFWVSTAAIVGWDSCAVARDIRSREGYTLLQGRYVYYRALQMGKPVPPLGGLLADDGKTDLASQFQLCASSES